MIDISATDVKRFSIIGTDLVIELKASNEIINREGDHRQTAWIINIDQSKTELHLPNKNMKMLHEIGQNLEEGKSIYTLSCIFDCSSGSLSTAKNEINSAFKNTCNTNVKIVKKVSGSYRLNCTEFTGFRKPQVFTYNDFLDVFLSPINTVIINNKKYEKTDIDDQRKRELFFGGSIPDSADMLRNLYYVSGRNIESSPETTVDNKKQHLKQLLVAEDLFPTNLRYLFDNLPGLSEDKVLSIKDENSNKKDQWKKSEYIFPDECYSGLSTKISGISNKISTFISTNTVSEIINNAESSRKKIDDCIVVLYFIALANYEVDDVKDNALTTTFGNLDQNCERDDKKDDPLNITRESFLSKLNNLLARLFASDSSNPETMEISGLIAEILTKFKSEQLTIEETAKIIFELKMRKIDQNQYEYSDKIDHIDLVDETKHHGR